MQLVEVNALAESFAARYNPEGVAPFPFENILNDRKDLVMYVAPLEDEAVSGAISFQSVEKKFTIVINECKSAARRHFTIAHELGHYFLHQDLICREEVVVDGDDSLRHNAVLYRLEGAEYSRVETEANNFAATLLMPEVLVRRAWEQLKSIEECARVFQVSATAMSIRLERVGLLN